MSNSVHPWIRTFVGNLLNVSVPANLLPNRGDGSSASSEKNPSKTVRRLPRLGQVMKYIDEVKALILSDTECTIPVFLTKECVELAVENGIKWSDLRTSIISLDDYFLTTALHASKNISLEQLQKYGNYLSFPLSIVCNEFTLMVHDLQIMKDPKDINKDKDLLKGKDHFSLYLQLSIGQVGLRKNHLPVFEGEKAIPLLHRRLREENDVYNLLQVVERNSALHAEDGEGTLREEDGETFHENPFIQFTQAATQFSNTLFEATLEGIPSEFLSHHQVSSNLVAANGSPQSDLYSTGGLRMEIVETQHSPNHQEETLRESVPNQNTTEMTQTSEASQRNDVGITQHSPETQPSKRRGRKRQDDSHPHVSTTAFTAATPSDTLSVTSKSSRTLRSSANKDSYSASQVSYTYETVPPDFLVRPDSQGKSSQHSETVSSTQATPDIQSFVEESPGAIVIINDNNMLTEVKLRKVRKGTRGRKGTKASQSANRLSSIQEADHDDTDASNPPSALKTTVGDSVARQKGNIQQEAIREEKEAEVNDEASEDYGHSLVGRRVVTMLTRATRNRTTNLVHGTITEFNSPYYMVSFENGTTQMMIHHEIIPILSERDDVAANTPSMAVMTSNHSNPHLIPGSQQPTVVASKQVIDKVTQQMNNLLHHQKESVSLQTPDRHHQNLPKETDSVRSARLVVVDLRSDMDLELTQPQYPPVHEADEPKRDDKKAPPSQQDFIQLQSPKKKRKPSPFANKDVQQCTSEDIQSHLPQVSSSTANEPSRDPFRRFKATSLLHLRTTVQKMKDKPKVKKPCNHQEVLQMLGRNKRHSSSASRVSISPKLPELVPPVPMSSADTHRQHPLDRDHKLQKATTPGETSVSTRKRSIAEVEDMADIITPPTMTMDYSRSQSRTRFFSTCERLMELLRKKRKSSGRGETPSSV